jgi:hypothetical protein
MRVSKTAAAAAIGLLLLAGCSRGGGAPNSASAGGAAQGPASGPDVAIQAADMPHPKAGLWETATTTNGSGPELHKFCESGKPVSLPANMGQGCQSFSFKRTFLGAFVIDAACAEGPVATRMHMTISGDFNTSYTSDTQASILTQGHPASTFTTHAVSHWIGPCPAGMAPDD